MVFLQRWKKMIIFRKRIPLIQIQQLRVLYMRNYTLRNLILCSNLVYVFYVQMNVYVCI